MWRCAALCLAAAMLLGGCSVLELVTGPQPQQARIWVSNGTTLPLTLFVNDTEVEPVPAGGDLSLAGGGLPPLPWSVEARTSRGRVIGSFSVTSADLEPIVGVGRTGWTTPGDRVDLSCGMLVMWAGDHELEGPARVPGTPGDCEP